MVNVHLRRVASETSERSSSCQHSPMVNAIVHSTADATPRASIVRGPEVTSQLAARLTQSMLAAIVGGNCERSPLIGLVQEHS